jgi:hypothetical protein
MRSGDTSPGSRLERYAPLAGLVAAVLWVVSLILLEAGGNPGSPESAEVIADHFRENRGAILAAGTLHALGGVAFLAFVASLHALVRQVQPARRLAASALLVGGIAAGAMMLALMGPQTTGATTDVELLGPESSLAFWRLAHVFFVAAEFAMALFVAAVSLLALSGPLLPRWVGWAGLVLALALLITPIGWIALLFLLPLWLAAVSLLLFARTRRPSPAGRTSGEA